VHLLIHHVFDELVHVGVLLGGVGLMQHLVVEIDLLRVFEIAVLRLVDRQSPG
jgi:hypothetical protein